MRKFTIALLIAATAAPSLAQTPAWEPNWTGNGPPPQVQQAPPPPPPPQEQQAQAYNTTEDGVQYWQGNDGRYYCKKRDGTVGLLAGAALGALLGRAIDTHGERATGTILGAIAGAVIGNKLAKGPTRCN